MALRITAHNEKAAPCMEDGRYGHVPHHYHIQFTKMSISINTKTITSYTHLQTEKDAAITTVAKGSSSANEYDMKLHDVTSS